MIQIVVVEIVFVGMFRHSTLLCVAMFGTQAMFCILAVPYPIFRLLVFGSSVMREGRYSSFS